MTTVSSPKEISALFANTHDYLPAIIGKPSDDEVQHIFRRNFSDLQGIYLEGDTDTTCIILSKDNHKTANANQVFD